MRKTLLPTNDYVFKRIFGRIGNEDITRDFIKAATGIEFKNINLDGTPILERDLIDNKMGVLDVKVLADDINNIDLEMQVVKSAYIADRILWYWAKMYSKSVKSGDGYDTSKKAICILIADFKIDSLKEIPEYYTRWKIREEKYKDKILTDKLDIVIIELDKLDNINKTDKKELLNWCKFIKDPEKLEDSIMSNNEYIKKAKEKLDEISQDEEEIKKAELRERALKDEKAIIDGGYIDGKRDGLQEGIQEGIRKGVSKNKIEIAKRMLKKNMSIEDIMEITQLTKNEIQDLK